MNARKFHMHDGHRGAAIKVKISPNSAKSEITEIMLDGTIKINLVTSNPTGNYNKALLQFLSDIFGVASSKLDIIVGVEGNDKLISVLDIDAAEVQQKLLSYKKS